MEVGQRGGCWSRGLKADFIVDRISEPLLAAEISFGRLNADMTEQELDLLKLSACFMTQTGTGATKIVGRNAIQTAVRGSGLYDAPDDFWTETARCDPPGLIDRPKDRTGRDTCLGQPVVHRKLHPGRDWHSSNVTTLADEVGDYPMLFSLLEVLDGEPSYLLPPEAATEGELSSVDRPIVTSPRK